MKIYYDKETDSAYLELSQETPDGVVEITEGVNLDTTKQNRIVGIELLNASQKISLDSFKSSSKGYTVREKIGFSFAILGR
jgi:uncharacterized protein YuzE